MTHCFVFVVCIAIAVEALKLWTQDLVVPGAVRSMGKKKKKNQQKGYVSKNMNFCITQDNRWLQMGESQGTDDIIVNDLHSE